MLICLIFWSSSTVLGGGLVDKPAPAMPGLAAAYLSSNQSGLRRRTGELECVQAPSYACCALTHRAYPPPLPCSFHRCASCSACS